MKNNKETDLYSNIYPPNYRGFGKNVLHVLFWPQPNVLSDACNEKGDADFTSLSC